MTRRVFIGIDPGAKGGVVGLHYDEAGMVEARGVPANGKGGYQRGNLMAGVTARLYAAALGRVAGGSDVAVVMIENLQTRSTERRRDAVNAGIAWGVWLAYADLWGWPIVRVDPKEWQGEIGARVKRGGDIKAVVLAMVQARLPTLDLTPGRVTVPHSGLSDAAGIALAAVARFR